MKHDPHAKSLGFSWNCPRCLEINTADDMSCTACGHDVPRTRETNQPDERTSFPTLTDREAEEVREKYYV